MNPNPVFMQAVQAANAGQFPVAEAALRRLLAQEATHFPGLNMLAAILLMQGKAGEAEPVLARAVALNPQAEATLFNYALALDQLKKYEAALEVLGKVLALNDRVAETWSARGAILHRLKRYQAAIADFDQALKRNPNLADAVANKGTSLFDLRQVVEAKSCFERALALNPNLLPALIGQGNVQLEAGLLSEASASFEKAIALDPNLAEAWLGRANARIKANAFELAFADYDHALRLAPDLAAAWIGKGHVHLSLGQVTPALEMLQKAVEADPTVAKGWFMLGNALTEHKRMGEAAQAYDKAFALDPDVPALEGARLAAHMKCCDWQTYQHDSDHLLNAIRAGRPNSDPFALLAIESTAQDQLRASRLWSQLQFPKQASASVGVARKPGRIRLGYLSADFYTHATALLAAGLFEAHDRARFEVFAFSTGPNDGSPVRARLEAGFEHFLDLALESDDQICQRIRDLGIDVLIDLKGFTMGARTGILAQRPASVQVNYLGYPGTMGADFIDYIIADKVLIPPQLRAHYSEQVVYMPHSYQVTDDRRALPTTGQRRADHGLPEDAVVLCCFNNNYKINPQVFDCWAQIMTQLPGSVLWLLADNDLARGNLCREAQARGIDPARLIFAQRASITDHINRHALADLFMDSWPYNAHTTASDALWAGLPVVTCAGETFPARVAASLLQAVGLPELVTQSREAYVQLIVDLARDPARRAKLKDHLNTARTQSALFDTKLFARHLEAAVSAMHERFISQQGAQDIDVAAL